jgi:hypothetical protein
MKTSHYIPATIRRAIEDGRDPAYICPHCYPHNDHSPGRCLNCNCGEDELLVPTRKQRIGGHRSIAVSDLYDL